MTTGAFNGTSVFLRVHDGDQWLSLGGQMSHTETLNNNPIEISSKSGGDFKELLEGTSKRNIEYQLQMMFVSQAGFDYLRALAADNLHATFQVIRGDVPTGTAAIELVAQVTSVVENSPDGRAVTASVTLQSTGEFVYNANYTYAGFFTSDAEPFYTSDGNRFYVRN